MKAETQTTLSIPYPAGEDVELVLTAGACRLFLEPADQPELVSGELRSPSGFARLDWRAEGGTVYLRAAADPEVFTGILSGGAPEFRLRLGTARPLQLRCRLGAGEYALELGGVPLDQVEINGGAGKLSVSFAKPNPRKLAGLKLGVGAGQIEAAGLGNARFAELAVDGGAAHVTLDLSGVATDPGSIRVSAAMAAVELSVPAGVGVEVVSDGLLGSAQPGHGFSSRNGAWVSSAVAAGAEPRFRVRSSLFAGSLKLSEATAS